MQGLILGYGNMGHIHRYAAELNGAEIIGIVDPDKRFQAEANVFPAIGSLVGLKPDFAVIATPTPEHLTDVEAIIEHFPTIRGILLEKPPVRTSEDLKRLTTVAADFGHIFIGEVEHYNPDLEQFTAYEGSVRHVRLERMVNLEYFLHGTQPWFLDEAQSGGIIVDTMIHDLNLLVGKYGIPKTITDVTGEKRYYDIYDNVRVLLDYGNFTAEIIGSWTAKNDRPILVDISITNDDGKNITLRSDNYVEKLDDQVNPYVLQMKEFLTSVQTGKLPVALATYIAATDLALKIRERLA